MARFLRPITKKRPTDSDAYYVFAEGTRIGRVVAADSKWILYPRSGGANWGLAKTKEAAAVKLLDLYQERVGVLTPSNMPDHLLCAFCGSRDDSVLLGCCASCEAPERMVMQ